MLKYHCHRKECSRTRSELGLFMSRKRPPLYEGYAFCSESCLLAYFEGDLQQKWRRLQAKKSSRIPRPKLGTILLQMSRITRDQIEEAVRLQNQKREGRIGEWLQRLGFAEEHEITAALAKQVGLPVINLSSPGAIGDAARQIPGKVARSSGLIPVGFDDRQGALRVAVSAPVDFSSHDAIRRMVRKEIIPFLGARSAIDRLMNEYYGPDESAQVPTFASAEDLLKAGLEVMETAISQRAQDIQAELVQDLLWMRLDFPSESHHYFFRFASASSFAEERIPGDVALSYAVGS